MTSICLQNQTFDFIKSSICLAGLTYILNLSSDSEQIGRRNGGQNLDKNWTSSFCHLPSSHPSPGQKLDNFWTLERPKFVHLLSTHHLSYFEEFVQFSLCNFHCEVLGSYWKKATGDVRMHYAVWAEMIGWHMLIKGGWWWQAGSWAGIGCRAGDGQ